MQAVPIKINPHSRDFCFSSAVHFTEQEHDGEEVVSVLFEGDEDYEGGGGARLPSWKVLLGHRAKSVPARKVERMADDQITFDEADASGEEGDEEEVPERPQNRDHLKIRVKVQDGGTVEVRSTIVS